MGLSSRVGGTDSATIFVMGHSRPLVNYVDAEGAPICPSCGRAIRAQQAAMRIDDCMIHVACLDEARAAEDPCEPSP